MGITSTRELVDAEEEGRVRDSHWVKNVTQQTGTGLWFDLTGSSGNPRAKQWFDATPLTAQQIRQSTDGGIYHGGDVSPASKFLRSMRVGNASGANPTTLLLCDYLTYYPTVEDGTTDPQILDNTLTLPRYTDGKGVQMMAITISARTGGQSFNVSYTNQDGTAGRTSQTVVQNASAVPGMVTTSATATALATPSPFIGLADGDSGVRSVESVTMLGADTGFFALVLVKPLAMLPILGIQAPYEKDFVLMASEMERIYDDAYLSMLALPATTLNNVALRGNLRAIWN